MTVATPAGIREATPADEPALRALQAELADPSPAALSYALSGGGIALVYGDEPAGYLIAFAAADAYIAEVVVAPGRRREGIASALVEAAVRRAKAADCEFVRLAVDPDNEAARRCYRSCGFAVEKRVSEFYDGDPALIMGRRP